MRVVLTTILVFLAASSLWAQYDVQLTPACFNTSFDDFGTRKLGDRLFVLSASKDPCEDVMMDPYTKKPYSDLYEVEGCKTKDAKLISAETKGPLNINSCFFDGPISSNAAGNILFFTNNFGSNENEKLTIHYSFKNDKGEWSKPLPVPFNNDEYNVTHPFFDEKNKVLYFASDMPGGLGGMDIYRANFDGKKFGEKELVRFVNTKGHDCFPLVFDNKLYFSSDANSIGGYDLFYMENFEVKSMGDKFNSKYDDLAIMFNDKKSGFITSNRANNGVTDDIYAFQLIDLFVDVQLSYVVKDKNSSEPLSGVEVKVVDDSTGVIVYQGLTDDFGKFIQTLDSLPMNSIHTFTLTMKKEGYVSKDVSFTFDAKDTNTINVSDLADLTLEPLSIDMIINELLGLKSIYYDFDKADLRADAIIELDKVVTFMNKHPKIEIELGSHTDCMGPDAYNQALSDRRAVAAANYIKSRISNAERITFKGYGESMQKAKCPCDVKTADKCTAQDNQLNRRTEFTIKSLNISTASMNVNSNATAVVTSNGGKNFTFNDAGDADFRITPTVDQNEGVVYRVQVESSAVQIPNATVKYNSQDVYEYQMDNSYKYCLGGAFKTLKEAVAFQDKMRANGYAQAFIIAFNQGKRISLDEAKKLTKE
ncbi:MAG: OmpA family protein [Crocinitomicaceae bacterium]|jgi:outer membrane protein OmpA-like peptidoglycan-associated protein|nr:OmpA family protein [Crocinitomicaceae bacterium]